MFLQFVILAISFWLNARTLKLMVNASTMHKTISPFPKLSFLYLPRNPSISQRIIIECPEYFLKSSLTGGLAWTDIFGCLAIQLQVIWFCFCPASIVATLFESLKSFKFFSFLQRFCESLHLFKAQKLDCMNQDLEFGVLHGLFPSIIQFSLSYVQASCKSVRGSAHQVSPSAWMPDWSLVCPKFASSQFVACASGAGLGAITYENFSCANG